MQRTTLCGARTTLGWGHVLVVWLLLITFSGCGSSRYLTVRKVPQNPLAGPLNLLSRKGPHPTARTIQTLRRYDLEKTYDQDAEEALVELQKQIQSEPTVDKLQAMAELAYIAGYKADTLGNDAHALDLYAAGVSFSYDYLFDPAFDQNRNPYDPEFRRACDVYNASLEAALRIVRDKGQLLPGNHIVVDTGCEEFDVEVVARGKWSDDEFASLEFVSDYEITGLKNRHHSYGLGVPLIGVRKPADPDNPVEQFYPEVLSFPVTAFLRLVPPPPGSSKKRKCVLEMVDPMESLTISVANRRVPLETDISAPLGYALQKGQTKSTTELATFGLINPGGASTLEGIYMIEPYDPEKIPVLMVHGLWSSPLTWMEMLNDLIAYPEIRRNYQFWLYLYPTGEPFWFSAVQLRKDLAHARDILDPNAENPAFNDMVIIGHSMGGLVSMLQTLDSKDDFWHLLSDKPFDQLQAEPEVRSEVAQVVFFHPNPAIRQVITIGTPHRGSHFSNQYTRFLARKLIRLPARLLSVTQGLVMNNPGLFRDTDMLTISTSIDSLSPKSPVLPAMLNAKRPASIHYHNILGIVPEKTWLSWFSERGDGVVSYESAHRGDFESELVVPADHIGVHAQPRSILEVRRILLENLVENHIMPTTDVIPARYVSPRSTMLCPGGHERTHEHPDDTIQKAAPEPVRDSTQNLRYNTPQPTTFAPQPQWPNRPGPIQPSWPMPDEGTGTTGAAIVPPTRDRPQPVNPLGLSG